MQFDCDAAITQIDWADNSVVFGIRVKPFFFDGDAASAEANPAKRILPFFKIASPKLLFADSDKKNFYHGNIVAQPDAVFEHANGLISVEYKSVGGKIHVPSEWRQSIRIKDMLQCLVAGFVVAQHYKKPTACVLRYNNVCYLLVPSSDLIEAVTGLVPMAIAYYAERSNVSSSQLAQFSVEKIRLTYKSSSPQDFEKSAEGIAAHASILRN
jgi:hypothetical protein